MKTQEQRIIPKLSKRLKALSDPTRIKILVLLGERPCCVCELAAILGLSQPTISRHLKQLEAAGFVSWKREKTWIMYSLGPRRKCCRKLLEIVLKRAREDEEARGYIEKLGSIDRQNITKTLFQAKEGCAI